VLVERFPENPLITPEDVRPSWPGFEVIGTFNAGAFELDGRIGLLVRVAERPVGKDPETVLVPVFDLSTRPPEVRTLSLRRHDPAWDFSSPCVVRPIGPDAGPHCYLTNLSHFRLAWSEDGRRFELDDVALWPEHPTEAFGIEDPRVTRLGDAFLITYSAVGEAGICVGLIATTDFRTFERRGVIFPHENKDVCLFPETMGGEHVALHRPSSPWRRAGVWLARSPDGIHWGRHAPLAAPVPGAWDSERIGAGPPPIRTDKGWLAIYHGVGPRGCGLGAMLLDADEPGRVLARSREPFLLPETEYERSGFVDNVVFSSGLVERNGEVWLYYGAADRVTAGAVCTVRGMLDSLG